MIILKISEAIKLRVLNLCKENNISLNRLAILGGQTQSTVQSLVDGKSKNAKILTIVRICDSLNISLSEFFNDELFKDIDIEI